MHCETPRDFYDPEAISRQLQIDQAVAEIAHKVAAELGHSANFILSDMWAKKGVTQTRFHEIIKAFKQ